MWVPVAVWQPCELLYTCYLLTDLPCLKTPPYYFLNNSVKNEPIWIIFSKQNSEEIWSKQFCFCPPHLQNVATVPWKSKKGIFDNKLSSIFSAASGQVLVARSWIYLSAYEKNCCVSPANWQNEPVCVPKALKQHNMHNTRASCISFLLTHGWILALHGDRSTSKTTGRVCKHRWQ